MSLGQIQLLQELGRGEAGTRVGSEPHGPLQIKVTTLFPTKRQLAQPAIHSGSNFQDILRVDSTRLTWLQSQKPANPCSPEAWTKSLLRRSPQEAPMTTIKCMQREARATIGVPLPLSKNCECNLLSVLRHTLPWHLTGILFLWVLLSALPQQAHQDQLCRCTGPALFYGHSESPMH